MESKRINLDVSAEELYAQLGGVEVRKLKKLDFSGSDRLAQSLLDEQKRYEALRFRIADLVYQIGVCLDSPSRSSNDELAKMLLIQFEKIFGTLSKNPQIGNTTLIRHRGAFGESRVDNKKDYEVLSGNISFDADATRAIAKGQGKDPSQTIHDAFGVKGYNESLYNIMKKLIEIKKGISLGVINEQ